MSHLFRARLRAAALGATVLAAAPAGAQCLDGRPPTATLGIGMFQCIGGSCSVNVMDGASYTHDFSTEPKVWDLEPGGPAAGVLREGDHILSIDGALVTSREGGRRLANLQPNVPVQLGIRREGNELVVSVTPRQGCNTPRLRTTATRGRPSLRENAMRPDGPGIYFGLWLQCGDCAWRRREGGWRWYSTQPIRITGVEPGSPAARAGIQSGDVLERIDGRELTSAGGSSGFYGDLRPGQAVRFQVRRGARILTIPVVPEVRGS